VSCRRWSLVAAWLGVLLCAWQARAFGQQDPITADQVVANYLQAIGGSDRLAAITTFAEKGELSGNLTTFGRPFVSPTVGKEHGTFEFYFKVPNLRFALQHRGTNTNATMQGCNGTLAWYVGPDGVTHESEPKAGSESECKKGYEPIPLRIRAPNLRLHLKGKKKVAGRMAWAVRAQDPKSSSTDTYYFDEETYLLLRWETIRSAGYSGHSFTFDRLYSDYRDVGGIKLAFMVVQQTETSSFVTILREVEINAPIDDARFQEPKVLAGSKNPHLQLEREQKSPEVNAEPSGETNKTDIPAPSTPPEAQIAPQATHGITTNFASFSVSELQQIIPELRGLKAADNQLALPALLDQVGNRVLDLSRKVPNLISHEEIESQLGAKSTRENFSYLILARRSQDAVTLDEFRIDLKSGAMLETYDSSKPGAPSESGTSVRREDLARASQRINTRATGGPPLSQGFASMWLRFYPSNRSESTFRYLGQQKLDGHHTLVVAFAQKPGLVRLPAEVRFANKIFPIYYQGIAWVDASDYRIVRLRTDLLSPVSDLLLTQLTAEVHFAETQAAGFTTSLWLPREVMVTSQVNGHIFHDKHTYSKYHSFQVHARILLDP